jgi:aspartyl aminopeptidase
VETKLCKRSHRMTLVGRGDKKRWVCNKCRATARRARGNARGSRHVSLASSMTWSSDFAPAVNPSYFERPEEDGPQ